MEAFRNNYKIPVKHCSRGLGMSREISFIVFLACLLFLVMSLNYSQSSLHCTQGGAVLEPIRAVIGYLGLVYCWDTWTNRLQPVIFLP